MNIRDMKKIMILSLLLLSGQSFAATITTTGPSTVNLNDIFTVDIVGTGFVGNVDGGGVNLAFDQNVFNVLSVSIDESVWNFGSTGISTGSIDNVTGTVDGIMVNTFADVSGDFVVATLEVQAVGLGDNSLFQLSALGINPWASSGSLINPSFSDSSISVSAVPVPAAIWLFGSGLIGIIGMARRKK